MNFRDDAMIKLRQTTEAHKIKELICKISHDLNLPEPYKPGDFSVVDGYIEPLEECSDVKIVVRDRYAISPVIIKKKAIGKKMIDARAWLVEEFGCGEDSREIVRADNVWQAARAVLLSDLESRIDIALHDLSEYEMHSEALKSMELFKNAA